MTQKERRLYLISELLKEQSGYAGLEIPKNEDWQKRLLRSLFNIRMPRPAGQEFLAVQDAYLQEEIRQKGITDLTDLTPVQEGIYLWQGDITTLRCDAIVNAANSQMLGCFVPCRYVLHTVGPIVGGLLTKKDKDLLASCYRSCLELAGQNHIKSIAFCCISTGEFHFPNERAAEIAIQTVKDYKKHTQNKIKVIFNVFKETDLNIYRKLLGVE